MRQGPQDGDLGTVIPQQNKDVCRDCDKALWVHGDTRVYFKWCKGCKRFRNIVAFSEKLDASKCNGCRERGRRSYLQRKGIAGEDEDDPPPAAPPAATHHHGGGGRGGHHRHDDTSLDALPAGMNGPDDIGGGLTFSIPTANFSPYD